MTYFMGILKVLYAWLCSRLQYLSRFSVSTVTRNWKKGVFSLTRTSTRLLALDMSTLPSRAYVWNLFVFGPSSFNSSSMFLSLSSAVLSVCTYWAWISTLVSTTDLYAWI